MMILGFLLLKKHSLINQISSIHSFFSQNKLLAMSVLSLLSKDDIPATPDINFRILANFIINNTAQTRSIGISSLHRRT